MKKVAISIVVLIILGFGYYAISPLFRNVEVNDDLPSSLSKDVSSGFENLTLEEQEEMLKEMVNVNASEPIAMEDEVPVAETSQSITKVVGTLGHPASGTVRVILDEETIIRFEDFSTINGPRLHLYLSKDLEGKDFVDLGPIRGTKGNINYDVPDGVDLSEYRYVLHWCVPFSVLFNYAELSI